MQNYSEFQNCKVIILAFFRTAFEYYRRTPCFVQFCSVVFESRTKNLHKEKNVLNKVPTCCRNADRTSVVSSRKICTQKKKNNNNSCALRLVRNSKNKKTKKTRKHGMRETFLTFCKTVYSNNYTNFLEVGRTEGWYSL